MGGFQRQYGAASSTCCAGGGLRSGCWPTAPCAASPTVQVLAASARDEEVIREDGGPHAVHRRDEWLAGLLIKPSDHGLDEIGREPAGRAEQSSIGFGVTSWCRRWCWPWPQGGVLLWGGGGGEPAMHSTAADGRGATAAAAEPDDGDHHSPLLVEHAGDEVPEGLGLHVALLAQLVEVVPELEGLGAARAGEHVDGEGEGSGSAPALRRAKVGRRSQGDSRAARCWKQGGGGGGCSVDRGWPALGAALGGCTAGTHKVRTSVARPARPMNSLSWILKTFSNSEDTVMPWMPSRVSLQRGGGASQRGDGVGCRALQPTARSRRTPTHHAIATQSLPVIVTTAAPLYVMMLCTAAAARGAGVSCGACSASREFAAKRPSRSHRPFSDASPV